MENDTQTQTAETAEEQTSQQTAAEETNSEKNEVKTLNAQKKHWRDKAESLEKEVTELRTKVQKTETSDSKPTKSDGSDYGRLAKLAYLKSEGITHQDDVKVIEDEAARLKLDLPDVLQMEHMQARLKNNADARLAQQGTPTGSKRTGGATQHDVDYWVQKGGLPEDDQELAEKVVNARMGKDTSQRHFDPIR